jgi:site-specific recombinase XerD
MPAPEPTSPKPKLLDRVLHACRVRHYSPRTADAYRHWVRQFVLFHAKRHPDTMGEPEVNAFLSHLAVDRDVAASTQNQAMAALLFLYGTVRDRPLDQLAVVRAVRPARLPTVLSRDEVLAVITALAGVPRLVAQLQYGAGLRVQEALALRVKDLDFATATVVVRYGKGGRDRAVSPTPAGPSMTHPWTSSASEAGILPGILLTRFGRSPSRPASQ